MANFNQQFQLLRCPNARRGCASVFRNELSKLLHHGECGFSPVQCSHDGCQATVNRQDLVSHQQNCEFRSVTCDDCHETMRQQGYGKHTCVLRRELTEVTRMLRDMQAQQLRQQTSETTPALAAQGQGGELVEFEATQVQQVVTRRVTGQFVRQPNATQRQHGNRRERSRVPGSITSLTQSQTSANRQIFVTGGGNKSYEVFDWSSQQWTLYKNALFFDHTNGFSFIHDNKVMIGGGTNTNRVEYLNISNIESVCTFPTQLPDRDCGKGVLCGDKILTFGKHVSASSLKPPFKTTVLDSYEGAEKRYGYGVARVNENAVVIVGGHYRESYNWWSYQDHVFQYNTTTNQIEELAPLPYRLSDMAVVVHNDNVIILGGSKVDGKNFCNDVLMYNITSQQCWKLPSMLEKRSNCAAVIMGDTIVAIGGLKAGRSVNWPVSLKTAEYLVLGEDTWKEFPPMHVERSGATACLLL